MTDSAFIITMAYPETIVMVADEWYSPFMRYVGIGKKDYVKAGHAALVLIEKKTGILEYHDFGRYITPEPFARVRGKDTDHELDFPLIADIRDNNIQNLEEILIYLATHPKFTHGEGKLIASICDAVNYSRARSHITMMQEREFIRYAAFIKDACNCARFVTDALIASVTSSAITKRLKKSKWFTPSTVGNVVIADTQNHVYEISATGEISTFKSTVDKENRIYFLDKLKKHTVNLIGTMIPKDNAEKATHAQWLSGIAAGAWFELYATETVGIFRFRRISPDGHIDCDRLYRLTEKTFNINERYQFVHYSNCQFFHIEQRKKTYIFEIINEN